MALQTESFQALATVLSAVFGATVKWLPTADKKSQRFWSLFVEAFSAAFVGFIVYCLCQYWHANLFLALALAAYLGNVGTRSIDLIGQFLAKKLGIPEAIEKVLEDNDDEENTE